MFRYECRKSWIAVSTVFESALVSHLVLTLLLSERSGVVGWCEGAG